MEWWLWEEESQEISEGRTGTSQAPRPLSSVGVLCH